MELTRKEKEVLRLIAQGHSNSRIAALLCLSVTTVRSHTVALYRKLGMNLDRNPAVNTRVLAALHYNGIKGEAWQ